jgi:hypothetical protein
MAEPSRLFIFILLTLSLLLESCTPSIYYARSNESLSIYETDYLAKELIVIPNTKYFKVKKDRKITKKGCWLVYSKDSYLGIICNPTFAYFGSSLPSGMEMFEGNIKIFNTPISNNTVTKSTYSAGSSTIHTGPKGGLYHYNSKGNKTYESSMKKSLTYSGKKTTYKST